LEGGESVVGIESTIVDFSNEVPTILRQGFITAEDIENVIKQKVKASVSSEILIAPGMMEKHYSPNVGVRLNATDLRDGEIGLGFGKVTFIRGQNLSLTGNLIEAASNLYSMLRALDKQAMKEGQKTIAVAPIPFEKIGIAINDRLKRAAVK
jgi:L-threonylcarbamoyladenylate synthase